MRSIIPYLKFGGKCREAMQFYAQCLGGHVSLMTYGGSHVEEHANEHQKDYILHGSLTVDGKTVLMACDSIKPQTTDGFDDNVSLSIDCLSEEELRQQFKLLSEGGSVTMAVDKQFWNAIFGMLKDKYGVHWMFNYELKSDNKDDHKTD